MNKVLSTMVAVAVAGATFGAFAQPAKKTETTVEAVQVILDEIARLQGADVPAEELAQRKKYLTGAFLVGLETPDGVAVHETAR